MSGVQEKQQDMDNQNQDKESDSKGADTETKQEIPDVQTPQLTPSKSPVRRAWRFFPCCCRRSPSPEPGSAGNKGSASSFQAHTSGTQSMTAESAEPAGTSKVPSREKASLKTKSFLHRLFGSSKERHTKYKNKHRSEDVKDGVLNGCTHGEASRPRPSRDKSKNKMKQSCSKTNIKKVIDSEQPTGSETLHSLQECTSAVTHISTCDIHPTESKEEEADDAASGTWQATNKDSDLTTSPRTESQSSSASPIPSHTANSLKSLNSQLSTATFSGRKPGDGCSRTSPLEQTHQPHVAPLPTYTEKYMEVIDSEQPSGSETLHSFQERTSTVTHISTCDIHPTESKEEEADDAASGDAASGTRQATNKDSDLTTSARTESQSSSASPIPPHTSNSLKSLNSQLSTATFSGGKPGDGCSRTSPLEQTHQPHVAPLPTYTEKYMEVIDSEQPSGSETLHSFQERTSTVTHISTCDIHPTESKEEESDDAASGTWQATNKDSDSTTNPRTESQSSSASSIPSHTANSLKSLNSQLSTATFSGRKPGDGCSRTSPLEQTSQPHVAPQQTCTERYRTTDTLQSVDEASGPTSSGQQDDLNVDNMITLSGIEELAHMQECQEEQEGATADENTQPAEDSSRETVCSPLPPYSEIYNSSYLPYIRQTHQNLPTFQRWQNNQPSQASSARTNFSQMQYPLLEREQDAVQDRNRTTDTLESANEPQGPRSSRQHDNRNVDETMILSHIEEQAKKQECQEEQEEATAAENTQPAEDSSRETVCSPLPPYSEIYNSSYLPYIRQTHQHLPTFQRWQNNQPSQASSARTNFYQRQHLLVEREQATVQEGTRTTDRLSANDEAHSRRSYTQQDNLNVDDTLSHIKKPARMQGCEDGQSGATAAQNTQSVEDSSKETACRPPPPYSQRHTGVFEPYTQRTYKYIPPFQRWEAYQSKQASSARTTFFQRQHPPMEREQDPVQEGTRTTETLHSSEGKSLGASSRRRRDNLNVDDTMMLNHSKKLAHMQDCKEDQEGATAAHNTQPVEESSKETVCRPFPPFSPVYTRVFEPYSQRTYQYPPTFQRWQNCQSSQASSARTNFSQRQHPLVERQQAAVQEENRPTDPLQSADEAPGTSLSRRQNNLNVDNTKTFNGIAGQARMQDCEEGQPGTTAAQNTQSVEDNSKETVYRPFPPFSPRYTRVFEPYAQRTHKYIPPFQRWETYQPRQASSARTNLYQRQHPFVEREQAAVQEENRTTDTLQSADEAPGTSSSRRQNNLYVDDTKAFNGIAGQARMQDCEEGQPGTTAAQNTQSVEDSSEETVYRTNERLSAGSSSGEEEDKCRICHSGSYSPMNPLLSPCRCSGSLQFVHLDCLKMWIRTKLLTRPHLYLVHICEVCLGPLTLDPATFDLDEYCRRYRPQILRWPGQFDERRMRFLRRPRQRRPPPEAPDT